MPARPPGAFTSGLPVHQVTLRTAGDYYGVTRERTPAGLSPASPSASFAALPPQGRLGWTSPGSRVLRGCCVFLPPLPPHFAWLRLAAPRFAPAPFALHRTGAACRAWTWQPGGPCRDWTVEMAGSPTFLRNP